MEFDAGITALLDFRQQFRGGGGGEQAGANLAALPGFEDLFAAGEFALVVFGGIGSGLVGAPAEEGELNAVLLWLGLSEGFGGDGNAGDPRLFRWPRFCVRRAGSCRQERRCANGRDRRG